MGLSLARRFCTGARIAILLPLVVACHGGAGTAIAQLEDSRRLAADLRLQFGKASDASNRAVMADTDEASVLYAHEAEAALRAVDGDVAALKPMVQNLGFSKETEALGRFQKHLVDYRTLDGSILVLAVENTNLKAQRLSFGPARQAADALRDSLAALVSSGAPADRCRIEELVSKAVLSVREIQVLQAPHIAEADDAAMTKMEQEMAGLEAGARDALKALGDVIQASARPALADALAALDRFKDTSTQIVALSRRNSNVRSLELSLRTKPALASGCDDDLRALQDALASEGSKATR